MRKYSIFHVPVLSFFSKKLYADIAQNWKGVNFLYLLLLLALCWIPAMIKIHLDAADFVNNEAPALVNQVPEITITDGKVSIEEEQPYYIKTPDSGKVLAIIDTTGQITSLDDTEAFCLLTGDKVIVKSSEFKKEAYDLSTVKAFSVDSERITGWLQSGRKFVAVAFYPLALAGSYMYRIVQALIYAAIGLLFAAICKTKLSYAALLRLSVAAVTPCIIVATILNLTDISLYAYLYLIAALAYLFFAVKSSSGTSQEQEETQVLRPDLD